MIVRKVFVTLNLIQDLIPLYNVMLNRVQHDVSR